MNTGFNRQVCNSLLRGKTFMKTLAILILCAGLGQAGVIRAAAKPAAKGAKVSGSLALGAGKLIVKSASSAGRFAGKAIW
jgi:hypothetical protein